MDFSKWKKFELEKLLWFILIALASLRVPAKGLSNLRVHIPATVPKGQSPTFECTFTLEDEKLYAIKWYRGNYEIFRFIPSETPNMKTFPLEGYNVSSTNSTGRTLQLYNVDFINSGAYSCEVIVDTTFHTLIETKKMLVIQTPSLKPTISAVKEEYKLGERINPMCTSWNSHPPANLSWFINGEPARLSYLRRYDLRKEHDGTFTSVLGLQFDLSSHHFKNGKLTLQCTATILSVYWRSTEAYIKEASLHPSQVQMNGNPLKNLGTKHQNHTRANENSLHADAASNITSSKNNNNNNNNNNMPVEQLTSHMLSASKRVSPGCLPLLLLVVSVLWSLCSDDDENDGPFKKNFITSDCCLSDNKSR